MRLEPAIPTDALAAIRAPFAQAGAAPTDAPVLQPLALLLDLAGEAMRARLFVVQGEGGEEAALRPDFTIPIARVHIDTGAPAGRYFYEGKAFRVAPPGAARAEEFLQIGLEAFGGDDELGEDAEIVALAWRAAAAGGRSDLTLVLRDTMFFEAFIWSLDLDPQLAERLVRAAQRPRALEDELSAEVGAEAGRFAGLLAGLDEAEAIGVLEEIWGLAGIEPVGGRSTADIAHRLARRAEAARGPRLSPGEVARIRDFLAISDEPERALKAAADLCGKLPLTLRRWDERLSRMAALGIDPAKMRFSTATGGSFSYYTGIAFEVLSEQLGGDQPVAAGGRYDGLTARLGGNATTAVGCMVRPARAYAGGAQ